MSNLPAEVPEESLDVLGGYSPQMLSRRLDYMRQGLGLMQKFFAEVMVEGQDYGVIPGTKKPSLYKCGAEKLAELYDYGITVKHVEEVCDRQSGFYSAKVTVALIQRRSGLLVAEGVGLANTMEDRYRWRWVEEGQIPQGLSKDSLTTKEQYGKTVYRVENPDPYTLWNTVLKMGKKRAVVDATLSATRSSGIFTQDTEELQGWIDAEFTVEGEDKPKRSSKPAAELRMPYGKDKGKPISQALTENLRWMLNQQTEEKLNDPKWGANNKRLKAALEAELARRENPAPSTGEPLNEEPPPPEPTQGEGMFPR